MKIGIVGTGQRSCYHGGCLFKDEKAKAVVSAVCDVNADRVQYAKEMYSGEFDYDVAAYRDYTQMFKDAGLDGIFIAAPNFLHCDIAVAAFEHGLHVMCDKPMDISLARCDRMAQTARKYKKVLGLGMQMHYSPWYHKAHDIIKGGDLGKVSMLWCIEYRGPFIDMKDWVWDPAKSGGAIHEKNCHHYDILNMWAGSKPTTVYASGGIMKHFTGSGSKSQIIDNAWVVNDYESGARAMVGVNFQGGKKHYREISVIGTEGRITFNLDHSRIFHVDYNDGGHECYDMREVPMLRGGMFNDFIDCCRSGKTPLVTPELGKGSIVVPMAAEISIRERRIVHVDELK